MSLAYSLWSTAPYRPYSLLITRAPFDALCSLRANGGGWSIIHCAYEQRRILRTLRSQIHNPSVCASIMCPIPNPAHACKGPSRPPRPARQLTRKSTQQQHGRRSTRTKSAQSVYGPSLPDNARECNKFIKVLLPVAELPATTDTLLRIANMHACPLASDDYDDAQRSVHCRLKRAAVAPGSGCTIYQRYVEFRPLGCAPRLQASLAPRGGANDQLCRSMRQDAGFGTRAEGDGPYDGRRSWSGRSNASATPSVPSGSIDSID